jgi:hypothetical protein
MKSYDQLVVGTLIGILKDAIKVIYLFVLVTKNASLPTTLILFPS